MAVATLHFICGKAGSGKTTLARRLGATVPAVVVCEDEWVHRLGFPIRSFPEFREASLKCRNLIGPLVMDVLRTGASVVMDFAGNTQKERQWVRSLFEGAGVAHVLHVIEASDAQCLDNIHRRNDEKPAGIFWGHVPDELFRAVNPFFYPPHPDEGFRVQIERAGSIIERL